MPIIRNPFRRAPGEHVTVNEENAKPTPTNYTPNGLPVKKSLSESSVTRPKSIELPQEAIEYKLSEINDSGVYLPPSPGETKSFWSLKSSSSTRSSHNHRNVLNENEPFNISRESFDSYRRSFDISARSPVLEHSPSHRSRQSLEARNLRFPSQQSFSTTSFTSFRSHSLSQHPSQRSVTTLSSRYTAEPTSPITLETDESPFGKEAEMQDSAAAYKSPYTTVVGTTKLHIPDPSTSIPDPDPTGRFEDVTLADPKPKRHGLFARFGVGSTSTPTPSSTDGADAKPASTSTGHSFFGRKRGGSGQGAELGNIIRRPASRGPSAVAAAAGSTATPAPLEKSTMHISSSIGRSSTPADNAKGPFAPPKTPSAVDKGPTAAAVARSQTHTPVSAERTRPQTPVAVAGAQESLKRPLTPVVPVAIATPAAAVPALATTSAIEQGLAPAQAQAQPQGTLPSQDKALPPAPPASVESSAPA